ncbi:hypothetical protein ACNOYE_30495 [Nannocystaceae bacterium ST9]
MTIADAEAWVAAGLVLQRGERVDAALVGLVRPWVESVVDTLALLPPLGVAADLARLIERAPFDIGRSQGVDDEPLRAALDAYEEHLLGRLSADFRLELARDALVRLPEAKRSAAVGVFVEQILARVVGALGHPLDSPAPGAVRRALQDSSVGLFERGVELLGDPEHFELREVLTHAYVELAAGARRCGALIGDVEIYTLENFEALRASSLRLAMAQIAEAAQSIERTLPIRVRRSEASRGRTPTRVEDESAYPIGGYASISNVGGIESLVSSELIYMTPEHERQAGGIDLFDVRWAADELLKYTRDESVHTRERRTIAFVLDPSLIHGRIKDPGLPFQRLVVLFGGLVAGVRKLCSWLDEADLHLHFVLVGAGGAELDPPAQPLRSEAELARLLLREFVESNVVEFHELADLAAALAHVEQASETGGSEVVWLAEHPLLPELEQGSLVRAHALAIGETHPRLWLDGDERAMHDEGWSAWLRVFQELLATLV